MKVFAVDPGYERVGIAVIEKNGGKEKLIFSECFHTSADLERSERLRLIGKHIETCLEQYKPDVFATESLFFAKNQKTALTVAEARGVIIDAASRAGTEIFEYTPLNVKVAVTGYGRSDKNQITAMVKRILKLDEKKRLDDEYDAMAIGLAHLATNYKIKR